MNPEILTENRPPATAHAPRIALYSPDSYGVGHFRRNRRVAEALLATIPGCSVLLLTGCLAADRFPPLPRTDLLRLPAVTKGPNGAYLTRSLGVDTQRLLSVRSAVIDASLSAYEPDILIVDHSPGGLGDELIPALHSMREGSRRPALVALGLRDIIDEPPVVRAQWRAQGVMPLLEWAYDEVWVYGRREVFDPVVEYGLPEHLAARVRFLGYVSEVGPSLRHARRRRPLVLAMGGGGEDALPLLATAIRARVRSPHRFQLHVLPGPLMPARHRRELEIEAEAAGGDVRVGDFTENAPSLVASADLVVSMGGYNSMLEILAGGVRSVIVPRVTPRAEQRVRAERMAARGWTTCLLPQDLSPARLLQAIQDGLAGPPPARMPSEFLSGASELAERCRQALMAPTGEVAPARWAAL